MATTTNSVYRIPPYSYIHVLDLNLNVTRLEIGPKTFVKQDNEKVIYGPEKMITIPPRNYCVIENPIIKDKENRVQFDENGQAKLAFADLEIRFSRDPFPLYPGEVLKQNVTPLKVIPANSALRLKAVLDFDDENSVKRTAGDEWLFEGPGTYIPRKEVSIEEQIRATIIKPNQAIRLRARKECTDRSGNNRVTGEEWIVKQTGAYLPGAYEEVVSVVDAYVLTEKKALHLRAIRTFTDDFNKKRLNGEEWLINLNDTETHIPNVYEEVVGVVNVTTLNSRQYTVLIDPIGSDGKPQMGKKKLVKGEKSFFLQPGEKLEKGIQDFYVLMEDEGLILKCIETFEDESKVKRVPGDRWMIKGPTDYVPPVECEVITRRKAIPLDENEGIYVRDIKSGKIRAVIGETYMLNQDEELWSKELAPEIERLLLKDALADRNAGSDKSKTADKTRNKSQVVTYRVPHNAAVQIYDYKEKKSRVIFGPELVMLGPDEQFTLISISGEVPKKPNQIKALCLLLGPDFFTDIIQIETADHARLSLKLSYNWHFQVNTSDEKEASKLFNVPDFVGDACKAIASRVRGAVAGVTFDDFHKNSASIIRTSVFGLDENKKIRNQFLFKQNNLAITSVDIQAVEPVDQRTRDSLQKSVQLAIEITTNSQEAAAKHEAERLEQEARGKLERQKIIDEAEAEKARRALLELQALSAAVESTGQAKAEAQSRAEALRIEGEAAVEQARLKAQAAKIEADSELERLTQARNSELEYTKQQNAVEISKNTQMNEIETNKFRKMVEAIGAQTLKDIATSGPDHQLKMLQALGLQSTLITDGSNPINLFNTANGLIGALAPKKNKTNDDN
jgi:major vault protein